MSKRELSDYDSSSVSDGKSSTFKSKKIKTDSLQQDIINYSFVPSLESIAIVNIVVNLWKHTDFRDEILNNSDCYSKCYPSLYSDRHKIFDQLLKKVSEKLSFLFLPNSIKKTANNVIRPIGLELVKFIGHYDKDNWYFDFKMEIISFVCWTMNGTIDKAKTLESCLGNNRLLKVVWLDTLFQRACEYCLEDHIINLWEQMSKVKQEMYSCYNFYESYDQHLIAYWVCFAKNVPSKLWGMIKRRDHENIYNRNYSIYKNMLTSSVLKGKALAVKYFWNKLTDKEKNNNKVRWVCLAIQQKKSNFKYIDVYSSTDKICFFLPEVKDRDNEYTDIMCFLLSEMNDKEQQRKVFQIHSRVILISLLNWPWQTFLLSTIELMWDYLDSKIYIALLSIVLGKINRSTSTGKIFKELWCNSPINFKKHFIQHIIYSNQDSIDVLWNLFQIEDIETIKLIFNDSNVEEKNQIIFSTIRSNKLFELIYTDKLSLVEILIVESLMSECEIEKIKEGILQKHGDALCCYWIHDGNWQAVEKILEWGFTTQDQVDILKMNIVNRIKEERSLGILGAGKWSSFEYFINWCFNCDEEINQFKIDILPYDNMESFVFDIIVSWYNFEFAEQFLVWCFPSINEIDQFKKKLMPSDKGVQMFYRFKCGNFRVNDCKYSQWELVVKLTEWFHPFEKEVLIAFKGKFKQEYFDPHGSDSFHLSESDSDNDYNASFQDDELDAFFFFLDSFIHGFNDRDWFNKSSGYKFEIDIYDNDSYGMYDSGDLSCDCSDTSCDCSSSECSSSSFGDDYANILMGELLNDDYEDTDYNGEIILY